MLSPFRCPDCGAQLDIIERCEITEITLRYLSPSSVDRAKPFARIEHVAPAALCPACEFCIEITPMRVSAGDEAVQRSA